MLDFENLDYYELLGVSRSASTDEIKRAYRREITKYHPDRFVNGTLDEQNYARLRSQHLNEAYAALNGQAGPRRSTRPASAAPSEPAPPRDHQAELYEQARAHLQAGRALQAIGVLRQLQQINPFYRDSAALLAQAEAQVKSTKRGGGGRRRPLLLLGAVAGAAVLAFGLWNAAGRPPFASGTGQATNTAAPIAAVASPEATPAPIEAVASPVPATLVVVAPTPAPSATPEPTATPVPATLAPTATATPEPLPPTPPPLLAEVGEPLLRDEFTGEGWADIAGNGWVVGYQGERYRITANPNAGPIWSYRSGAPINAVIGVDVQITRGVGGIMLRFVDDFNYLSFTINPAQTSFRLEQISGGLANVLAGGQSGAISADPKANNRVVVRITRSRYQLFANDQLLAEGDLPPGPISNRYGLLVIGGDTAAVAYFDNVEIRAP